ncbi:MAG TPA: flagellar basal body L-ring protein FlgH [Candidatus Baltobacteraceae bacterium]|jgi:flagellar L-ring protein precursor FlgH
MKKLSAPLAALALFALLAPAANADTLYQAAPPPAGPGHPLRLGPDHRAQQVGDLVYIVFDFSSSNAKTNNYDSSKSFSMNQGVGIGNLAISLLRNGASLGGDSSTSTKQAAGGASSFVSTMMATVTDVLPSGVLQVQGDQGLLVNGSKQTLHITGYMRPEDIDTTDAILSSRVANVDAVFSGNDQKNKGLLSRILSWLF